MISFTALSLNTKRSELREKKTKFSNREITEPLVQNNTVWMLYCCKKALQTNTGNKAKDCPKIKTIDEFMGMKEIAVNLNISCGSAIFVKPQQ